MIKRKKIAIKTLGCKLNFSESATIERLLAEQDYKIVSFENQADVYIINTCAVTQQAEKKCMQTVNSISEKYPNAKIVLVGCYSELQTESLSSIEKISLVLGSNSKFQVTEFISQLFEENLPIKIEQNIDKKQFISSYSLHERTRSFLKIQDGCDYYCTYCTVPYARGNSRSDSIENIIKNAENIVSHNIKEIILSGVNIGDFKTKEGHNFLSLLQSLTQVNGLERIRISSIEPNLLTDKIIDFVSKNEKILPHFHIPLQSGSDKILQLMKRRYKRDLFAEKINRIKEQIPQACIAADVIVGFPCESEEDFQDTYKFINSLPISYLHIFPYSKRPGTIASQMEHQIEAPCKSQRVKSLLNLSNKKKQAFYSENIGAVRNVLVESKAEQGYLFGFTENYIKVRIPYDSQLPNSIQKIYLKTLAPDGSLAGEILEHK